MEYIAVMMELFAHVLQRAENQVLCVFVLLLVLPYAIFLAVRYAHLELNAWAVLKRSALAHAILMMLILQIYRHRQYQPLMTLPLIVIALFLFAEPLL